MAVTTKMVNQQSSLKRRIRQFYNLLNQRDFRHCYQLIDPRVRRKPRSVTLFQYENALRQFIDQFGPIKVLEMSITLHVNEPSELYEGRDFAVGKTTCVDEAGERQVLSERWVREGRAWYTRSTGFVTPATSAVPLVRSVRSSVSPRKGKLEKI
jgi:hypothetical protein